MLLFMGAMGKSAQFLLHTWLPDAMEGPTPVSALIHAATMVTAGVFMVARLSPLFELAPNAQAVVMFFGATTAFFAATIGLVQNDIKRIVAYSTCSQLGYMFVAMGAGAYSVGMFHLFTHAFFKALLFLGSGSVIYAMHHEQDIRNMGGLKDKIPFTYIVMVIGTLALTGFPLTAGYFSKDAIIESAYVAHNPFAFYGFLMTVIAAGLTSFYSWRLIFKTFHGEPHDQDHYEAAHESPLWMLIPIGILAAGSILAGFPFKELFAGHGVEEFFRGSVKMHPNIIEEMHHIPRAIAFLPTVGPKRSPVGQSRVADRRAQVGEAAESLTECQEPGLGTVRGLAVLVLRMTHGAEEHRVGGQTRVQRARRERLSVASIASPPTGWVLILMVW